MHSSFDGIVYHGSNAVFENFDIKKARVQNDFFGGGVAYFTGSRNIGVTYAKSMSKLKGSPVLYTVNVRISKLFDTTLDYEGADLLEVLPSNLDAFARGAGLLKYGADKARVMINLKSGKIRLTGVEVFRGLSNGMVNTATAREHLMRLGYNGLRYRGGTITGSVQHDVYITYPKAYMKIRDAELLAFRKS